MGRPDVVDALLEYKADVNHPKDGATSAMWAAAAGLEAMWRKLQNSIRKIPPRAKLVDVLEEQDAVVLPAAPAWGLSLAERLRLNPDPREVREPCKRRPDDWDPRVQFAFDPKCSACVNGVSDYGDPTKLWDEHTCKKSSGPCPTCGWEFPKVWLLARHVGHCNFSPGPLPLRCVHCMMPFAREDEGKLRRHEKNCSRTAPKKDAAWRNALGKIKYEPELVPVDAEEVSKLADETQCEPGPTLEACAAEPESVLPPTFLAACVPYEGRVKAARSILITGPSGCGKSRLLEAWRGGPAAPPLVWDEDPIIDHWNSGDKGYMALGAAGFHSVPSMQKPYHCLSQAERTRADLARLATSHEPGWPEDFVEVDEFTSVLDRSLARAICMSVQKISRIKPVVVATCHFDVAAWLNPEVIIVAGHGKTFYNVAPHVKPRVIVTFEDRELDVPESEAPSFTAKAFEARKASGNVIWSKDNKDKVKLRDKYALPNEYAKYTPFRCEDCKLAFGEESRLKKHRESGICCGENTPLPKILRKSVQRTPNVAYLDNFLDDPAGSPAFELPLFPTRALIDEEVPGWKVGLITGSSASGKTVVSRAMFGREVEVKWSFAPVGSHFPKTAVADAALEAVGLTERLRKQPIERLSMGEQTRAAMARVLVSAVEEEEEEEDGEKKKKAPSVVDDWTSNLDRPVALDVAKRVVAFARKYDCQLVFVTSHTDVAACGPCWHYDTSGVCVSDRERPGSSVAAGRVEGKKGFEKNEKNDTYLIHALTNEVCEALPDGANIEFVVPPIELTVRRCGAQRDDSDWHEFKQWHYKDHTLINNCFAFVALWGKTPVAFTSYCYHAGSIMKGRNNIDIPAAKIRREHRTVVHPSCQGMGFAPAIVEQICKVLLYERATFFYSKTLSAAYGSYRDRSPLWQGTSVNHEKKDDVQWYSHMFVGDEEEEKNWKPAKKPATAATAATAAEAAKAPKAPKAKKGVKAANAAMDADAKKRAADPGEETRGQEDAKTAKAAKDTKRAKNPTGPEAADAMNDNDEEGTARDVDDDIVRQMAKEQTFEKAEGPEEAKAAKPVKPATDAKSAKPAKDKKDTAAAAPQLDASRKDHVWRTIAQKFQEDGVNVMSIMSVTNLLYSKKFGGSGLLEVEKAAIKKQMLSNFLKECAWFKVESTQEPSEEGGKKPNNSSSLNVYYDPKKVTLNDDRKNHIYRALARKFQSEDWTEKNINAVNSWLYRPQNFAMEKAAIQKNGLMNLLNGCDWFDVLKVSPKKPAQDSAEPEGAQKQPPPQQLTVRFHAKLAPEPEPGELAEDPAGSEAPAGSDPVPARAANDTGEKNEAGTAVEPAPAQQKPLKHQKLDLKATLQAQQFASNKGIDLRNVQGSGKGGRILLTDVKAEDPTVEPSKGDKSSKAKGASAHQGAEAGDPPVTAPAPAGAAAPPALDPKGSKRLTSSPYREPKSRKRGKKGAETWEAHADAMLDLFLKTFETLQENGGESGLVNPTYYGLRGLAAALEHDNFAAAKEFLVSLKEVLAPLSRFARQATDSEVAQTYETLRTEILSFTQRVAPLVAEARREAKRVSEEERRRAEPPLAESLDGGSAQSAVEPAPESFAEQN